MRIYRHFEDIPPESRGGAIAVGNFDGVHLGHQAVINEAGAIARATEPSKPWGVLTFEPHPRRVFQPDGPSFRLSPLKLKVRYIEALGVDFMIVVKFDQIFAARPAQWFIDKVLVGGLNVAHLVAGYNFVFGRGRAGDCPMLLREGKKKGFGFSSFSVVTDGTGIPYSSTRVRDYLSLGKPRAAAAVLGRSFEIKSRVVRGYRRGRSLGFPTANMRLEDYCRPKFGVYAVRVRTDQAVAATQWMDGIANLGLRPTFSGTGVLLETHLFDWTEDLYGQNLTVALVDFIRPEIKFSGPDEIKAQIAQDCEVARQKLAESAP